MSSVVRSSVASAARTMRAVVVERWLKGPEELSACLTKVPTPSVDEGCVKVAVAAAGCSTFTHRVPAAPERGSLAIPGVFRPV